MKPVIMVQKRREGGEDPLDKHFVYTAVIQFGASLQVSPHASRINDEVMFEKVAARCYSKFIDARIEPLVKLENELIYGARLEFNQMEKVREAFKEVYKHLKSGYEVRAI